MDYEAAIKFLQENQPLPPDDELDEKLIEKFDEVCQYFTEHPSVDMIPLVLNAFGDGSGFGVYQVCDSVFSSFTIEEMTPHLIKALQSKHRGTIYWSTQIAANFGSQELLPFLVNQISSTDIDIRMEVITAIEQIPGENATRALHEVLSREQNNSVRTTLKEAIEFKQ